MKKSFFAAAAIALFTMASCSDDVTQQVVADGSEVSVSFTASLPSSIGSRAVSDGTTAKQLRYAVYEKGITKPVITDKATFEGNNLSTDIKLTLLAGRGYEFVFWADAMGEADGNPYTFDADARTIEVDYANAKANDESRDAFFGNYEIAKVSGPQTATITLKRPFAQINVGTNDWEDAKKVTPNQADPVYASKIVTKAYNTFNLFNCTVVGTETAEVTFDMNEIIDENLTIKVNGEDSVYSYLGMAYILMGENQENVDVTFTYNRNDGDTNEYELKVSNAPVQRNYRTNIIGSLLTNPASLTIVKDKEYDNDKDIPVYDEEGYRIAYTLADAQSFLVDGNSKVAVDGELVEAVAARSVATDFVEFLLHKGVAAQALKINGATKSPVKITYPETQTGVEVQKHTFKLIVTGNISAAEIDLPEAEVTLEGRSTDEGEKPAVENVTITNAASAAVTGEVAIDEIVKGEDVEAEIEFEGSVDLGVKDTEEFIKALANESVETIKVPEGVTINLASLNKNVIVDRNLTINNEGTITTVRTNNQANIIVDENVNLTISGEGTFSGDNRIIDTYGNTTIKNGKFITSTKNRGAILSVYDDGNLIIYDGIFDAGMAGIWLSNNGTCTIDGGKFMSESNSANEPSGSYSYYFRSDYDCTPKLIINAGDFTGIQGLVSLNAGEAIINGGSFIIHNLSETTKNGFYAVYATGGSYVYINGGYFYTPNDRSGTKVDIEGTSCVVSGDNDTNKPIGNVIMKGGYYSGKAYNHVSNTVINPAEGFEYQAVEVEAYGVPFCWQVVPTAAE